jgi:hypothetical protein
MKLIKFEPAACKEKDGIFKGYVSIEIPSYPQRLKYIKECQFQVAKDDKGQVVVSESMSNIDALIKMVELAKVHVKEVKVTKCDEDVYKTFADMLDDADCDEMINEISGIILNGIKLGKS